jgi:hypothetical protein
LRFAEGYCGGTGNGSGVIVFDDERLGIMAEDATKISRTIGREGSPSRVLGTRSHDDGPTAAFQDSFESLRPRSFLVQCKRIGDKSGGRQHVSKAREDRILHPHAITGPEVVTHDQIDPVETAAHDSDRGGRHPIGFELCRSESYKRRKAWRLTVKPRLTRDHPPDAGEWWKKLGVRIARRKVYDADGQPSGCHRGNRWWMADNPGSPSPLARDESTSAQKSVSGCHRHRTHPERLGERSDGREQVPGGELASLNGLFERRRDGGCGSPRNLHFNVLLQNIICYVT